MATATIKVPKGFVLDEPKAPEGFVIDKPEEISVEPTEEDVEKYRSLGVEDYRSPSGKLYDFRSTPITEALGEVTAPAGQSDKFRRMVMSGSHPYMQAAPPQFDPEGSGYDYETAKKYGIKPDATGHWPSRVPQTGQILKGQKHPTYNLTVEGERKARHRIYKGSDGRYYSQPQTRPVYPGGTSRDIRPVITGKPKAGFVESLKEEFTPIGVAKKIPIIGGIAGIYEASRVMEAKDRLVKGYDYSQPPPLPVYGQQRTMMGAKITPVEPVLSREGDEKLVADYIERITKDRTFWGKVAQGVSALPTWMLEFAITGGLASVGKTATKKAGLKLLGRYAKTKAGKTALRGMGWAGGAITRGTVGLAPRIGEKAVQRQLNVRLLNADQEGWATSFAKSWGDVVIEAASEEAGQTITKGLGAIANKTKLGSQLVKGLRRGWRIATGGSRADFARGLLSKGGYSNIIGEIGEERLATILRGITGVDDFGAGKDAGIIERLGAGLAQDARNFGVEAVVLSTPMAGQVAVSRLAPAVKAKAKLVDLGPTEVPLKPTEAKPAPELKKEMLEVEVGAKPGPAKTIKGIEKEGRAAADIVLVNPLREPEVPTGKKMKIRNPDHDPKDPDSKIFLTITDYGTGLTTDRNKVIHATSGKIVYELTGGTAKETKHLMTKLSQTGIDWQQDEKAVIEATDKWAEGLGKNRDEAFRDLAERPEVEIPEIFQPEGKSRYAVTEQLKKGAKLLNRFVKTVPEFTLNPTLTYEGRTGQLVFRDRYRYGFYPNTFGIDAAKLKDGQTIRFDLESYGIKPATKTALKKAEPFLGEPEILGKPPKPTEAVAEEKPPRGRITIQDAIKHYKNRIATEKRKDIDRFFEGEIGRLEAKLAKGEKFVPDPTAPSPFGKLIKKPAPAVKPEAVLDPDKFRREAHKKYGEQKWDDAFFAIAEGETNISESIINKFAKLEDRLQVLDEKGEWNSPEGKRLQIEIDTIVNEYLEGVTTKIKEEPSEFIPSVPIGPEPKDVRNIVVDQFRQWPTEIKKVSKDFFAEAMSAAKQLLTPYRYKALRRSLLGVFRHGKGEVVGIELQDIRDVLTAVHELGHNIDYLLNKKTYPRSIKGRFPDTTVGERALRDELKKVSKVLRPDLWRAAETMPSKKSYVNRHTELMADYTSYYILDPEATGKLAPSLTAAFEQKLANNPELFEAMSRLHETRYEGPEEPPIAEHLREHFPLPKEFTPLQLTIDAGAKDYIKAAAELGIDAQRHYKLLIQRANNEAKRIDKLVPNKDRQTDLVVVAEQGTKNPWTGKTFKEMKMEGFTRNEQKAINLFRAYQEAARQTVNKYLRGANIAEYIKFIEDYFLHAYHTPYTTKSKAAIHRWAKKSPQAKKRVLPDLATAVELGFTPRVKTLSDGLKLWAGINYRVATNKAFLRILPQITNDDGVSILQKPSDFPHWPTVDYWPIRQSYKVPLPGRGVLLFQGRVAVDPRVKPFIDAMFDRPFRNRPVRIIEGLNATWKAFELTLFSFFHHQAEFFSAAGSLGPRAMPFVGGYYGKRAQAFGKKKLFGFLPARIGVLKAGKELEKVPEFMEDYIAHGGQIGYISTEGISLIERMLKRAADYLKNIIQHKPTTPLTVAYAAAYVPVKTAQSVYSFHQRLLWDNVQRAKLVSYYNIVADGAKNSDLPINEVKEIAAKYIADNFGGQEWLNTVFRKPKTRQFWTQLMMSLDWTWSQIKTARWPVAYGGKSKAERARRALMRKIGRHHWFWYLAAVAGFSIAGNYAMAGKGPWENEKGHKLDIDWTKIWRSLPWNRGWKERGDYSRRYIGLGKAGRELHRWVVSPLKAFGYKLSPVARSGFEQSTGYNIGSDWAEPWAREDLELYQEVYARFKHLMENFKPFAFSGNNAFLAFPSRKGMTQWKAIRAYEEIYKAKGEVAAGGITAKLTKAARLLYGNEDKLMKEIDEACALNQVNSEKARRAAISSVRSKFYSRFWRATKKQDIKACNRYADALRELGVTTRGFRQSMGYRANSLPEKAKKTGRETFLRSKRQDRERKMLRR